MKLNSLKKIQRLFQKANPHLDVKLSTEGNIVWSEGDILRHNQTGSIHVIINIDDKLINTKLPCVTLMCIEPNNTVGLSKGQRGEQNRQEIVSAYVRCNIKF